MKQIIDGFLNRLTSGVHSFFFDAAEDRQQRSLTKAYLGAFGIIAALTLVGHSLTSYIANNQKESAEITSAMSNLRSLMDEVIAQSSAYKASGSAFDRDLLNQSVVKLKRGQSAISARRGSTIDTIFNESPFLLNPNLKNFIDTTNDFIQRQETNTSDAAIDLLFASISRIARILAINLDLALEQYEVTVLGQAEQSFRLQYLSAITILLVLCLEALFIFRPLVRRLGEYHKDLTRLALTDPLTGLNNRRAFTQLANAGLTHFSRSKKPFAMVLADLDKFKAVNDTYGHKVGDLVLKHYAALMLQSFRKDDVIGRVGGEEFAIFLPETGTVGAQQIMERFRKAVMDTPCPYVDKNGERKMLSYTSSFGVVDVIAGDWTLDNLFILADENLYKAKDQGRNCVVLKEINEKAKIAIAK